MIEVEIKLPIKDIYDTEHELFGLGFHFHKVFQQTDTYFDNAQSQIRKEGKALRIRENRNITSTTKNAVLTFKGQKLDTVSMSRQEYETELADPDIMFNILQGMGYEPVAPQVTKIRKEYFCQSRMGELHCFIDNVENLGDFLELEMLVSDEDVVTKDEILEELGKILAELGYSMSDTVTDSYLSMLQGVKD